MNIDKIKQLNWNLIFLVAFCGKFLVKTPTIAEVVLLALIQGALAFSDYRAFKRGINEKQYADRLEEMEGKLRNVEGVVGAYQMFKAKKQ